MSQKTESYGSQYLYSEDLLINKEYKSVTVEIEEAIPPNTLRSADKKMIDKWTLKFKGKDKLLVLCKTNVTLIHCIVGEPPGDAWKGATINLQVRVVEAFGENVTALRVMPPNGCMVRKNVLKRLGTKAVWKSAV
jgi:hypothetical protein